jgi:hypothetical protein
LDFSSSLACATTVGADCACDWVVANCMAVSVVASNANRSFVMSAGVLATISGGQLGEEILADSNDRGGSTNMRWAGLWRVSNRNAYLFGAVALFGRLFVHDAFSRRLVA